jgi:hypothetical protein
VIPGRSVTAYVFLCKAGDRSLKVRVMLDPLDYPDEEREPSAMLARAGVQAKYLSGAAEVLLTEILETF